MKGVFIKDIDIPVSCAACRFKQDDGHHYYCVAFSNLGGSITHGITNPRPKWCPLKEYGLLIAEKIKGDKGCELKMRELVKKLNEKAVQNPYPNIDPFTVVFIGNTGLNRYKESVCAVIQYQR